MKRFLWLACISCCCSLGVVACGDDDDGNSGDGGIEDGGASNAGSSGNINQVKKDVSDLQDDVDMGLADVNGKIGDANDAIDDLDSRAMDLADRLDKLEGTPNCSTNEICIPDGVNIAQTGIASIVEQLCTLEIGCCNDNELNYKFGPGITDVKSCVATFTDLVNNGLSPSFLSENGALVGRVISIAQAINSNDVQVTIDAKAVDACVASLKKRECNKFVAEEEIEEVTHCDPIDYTATDDPCLLTLLVKGAQQEGDICGVTSINECAPGLACRPTGGLFKICAMPSAVGDACRRDADCDGVEQFCNLTTGLCQARGDEGDDCEYVDPTFSSAGLDPRVYGGGWQNPQAIRIECKQGLSCDPTSNKCVTNCSAGVICSSNAECPEGEVCNFTAVLNMYSTFHLGICSDPLAEDENCTLGSECGTTRCYPGISTNVCTPALKAVGAACTLATAGVPQLDATCITNVCGNDGKCAELCVSDGDCELGSYCDSIASPTYSPTYQVSECEPKKAAASLCYPFHIAGVNNVECVSGYCDQSTLVCTAKIALAAPCPAARPDACAASYCKFDSGTGTNSCTAFIAAGAACIGEPSECGGNAHCGTAGTNALKCVTNAAAGAACDNANNVICDPTALPNLSCAITNTTSNTGICAETGMYPDGASCGGDYQCLSTWCRLSTGTCEQPIAEGEGCDFNSSAFNRCAIGTYCKYPNLATTDPVFGEGECTAAETTGVACDPRFFNNDCIGDCVLLNDQFVCDSFSVLDETLYCDGD